MGDGEYAFRDRPLTDIELERLRLMLSTFRDGSGQRVKQGYMPNSLGFERSLSAVLNGRTPENKGIFDIAVPAGEGLPYGISCKMTEFPAPKHLSSFMEMSNAAAKFREHLLDSRITYANEPMLAGPAVIDYIVKLHGLLADTFDLAGSRYAVLGHDGKWEWFQVLCFPLDLTAIDPRSPGMHWEWEGKAINGYILDGDRRHRLWQYYPTSGGQLKFWPLLSSAEWVTPRFRLEQPQPESLPEKAQEYFGHLWPKA